MHTPTPKRSIIDRYLAFTESLSIGDRFFLKMVGACFVASLLWLGIAASSAALESVPASGGVLREGIIGTPRFINPLLAVTVADQDLTKLVYAGIMKLGPDGTLVPDLAESVTVSEDGKVYTVKLRSGITFHDGEPLSTDDIIFTVSRAQDPALKSPLRASWDGVSTERLSDTEMNFVLPEAYAPFMENLTLGILPKHIWNNATIDALPFSQYNSEPIGAGPYRLSSIERDKSGIPEAYELKPYRSYYGDIPKIATLVLTFYQNEEALVGAFKEGTIMSAGGLSAGAIMQITNANPQAVVTTAPLPRTFALFFNQNETPIFRDAAVRKALALMVDRESIIEGVLGGYGQAITSPIPPGFGIETEEEETPADLDRVEQARKILRDGGWRFNEENAQWEKTIEDTLTPLTFSISTSNASVFVDTATHLQAQWAQLGIPVTLRQFEPADLTQTIIRPRQYESLLFGTVVGRELDLFSFWHSSQRNDPGLNVALYTNITVDALLTKARTTANGEERAKLYESFSNELKEETPAIFLYVPLYTYVTTPAVHDVTLRGIANGSERFSNESTWYMQEDSVWPFFTR